MTASLLEQEIRAQPGLVERLLNNGARNTDRVAEAVRGRFDYVLIAARGTSDNAARYAQYLFGAHNALPVALAAPSLFTLYQRPPQLTGALVIGISQSGQSPDIVAVLAEARRQGRPTVAITNEAASPLAAESEHCLPLDVGPERAVAATKTYTASLAALAMLSAGLSGNPADRQDLARLPQLMAHTLAALESALSRVERYRYMDRCAVIGRGYNYATAFEIALKVKELTGTAAEPYSSADFRHGPIAMAHDGFPVILIAPAGVAEPDLRALARDLRQTGSELIVISGEAEMLLQAQLALPLPDDLPEWLSPAVAVLPGQLFTLALTQAKGLDPDRPRGLSKVTETF